MPIAKIISGRQTGADRAAFDTAMELGITCGGWCPKGRKAEDGELSEEYPLQETPSDDYKQRTEWNARDSDGTLVVTKEKSTGETASTMTARAARSVARPTTPHTYVQSADMWKLRRSTGGPSIPNRNIPLRKSGGISGNLS